MKKNQKNEKYFSLPQRPYRCPVCDGRGTVDAYFYSGVPSKDKQNTTAQINDKIPATCRSCWGTGIVWG